MSLIDDARIACSRLAPHGWHSLLISHGLDITNPDLLMELTKPLQIDRAIKGFEDFSSIGVRGIEPGKPAQSLLFHAFASPNVVTASDGVKLTAYPSALEIEQLLNLVYGINPPYLNALKQLAGESPLAIAVFAQEYRPQPETVHLREADFCFSRTGIARVGTAPMLYNAERRGFLPFVDATPHKTRVIPARYGAYIAMQVKGDKDRFGPMSFQSPSDSDMDFWVPLHKLFPGDECLAGLSLELYLDNYQINEKIRQVHMSFDNTGWEEPDTLNHPFVITEGLSHWATPAEHGLGLLVPNDKAQLVELAYYQGQPLSFTMPRGTGGLVHGRHRLLDDGSVEDLNNVEGVDSIVKEGGYRALHYQDAMADGWVRARCPQLEAGSGNELDKESVPAYSIIGAPDFFPLCGQRELKEWSSDESVFPSPDVWHTRVNPLSDVRFPINPTLPGNYFTDEDRSVTAIVSLPTDASTQAVVSKIALAKRQSFLPDFASGVFGPGWEIGRGTVGSPFTDVLNGYMLASPFTEDARICAALGSYWPGVAPDSTRTFEPRAVASTIIPLTDAEIGLQGAPSWDGLTGPVLINVDGIEVVQYRAYEYSDYTNAALADELSLAVTGNIDTQQYHQRVLAMYRAYHAVGAGTDKALRKLWPLLSFSLVQRPNEGLEAAQQQAGHTLVGQVMYFFMYKRGAVTTPADNFKLRHVGIDNRMELYVGSLEVLIKKDDAPWCLFDESL